MTPNEPSMRTGINLHITILKNVKYDFELAVFNENYKNISMKIVYRITSYQFIYESIFKQ